MNSVLSIIVYLKDEPDAFRFDYSSDTSFTEIIEMINETGWIISQNIAIPFDQIQYIERLVEQEEEQEEEHREALSNEESVWDVYNVPALEFEVVKKKSDKLENKMCDEMTDEQLLDILKDEKETGANKDKALDEINKRKQQTDGNE